METDEISSIIQAGVVFAVYLFVMILLYFVLSSPIDSVMNGIIGSASNTLASDEMTEFSPNFTWAVKLAFAISIAIPVTWFVFWLFSKEPFVGIRRY